MSTQKENCDYLTPDYFRGLPSTLPFSDPGYHPPEPEEVDKLVKFAVWSQTQAAKVVGVKYYPQKGSQTIQRWKTRKESAHYREIPYAAWRLMLINAGIVTEDITYLLKSVD